MTFQKPKITKKEVSQKFNLKSLFQKDFSGHSDLRDEIAQAIIDKIVERTTEDHTGINGKALKSPYSERYVDSSEFKDHGKSKRTIDMTLTGRMLDAIDETDETTNTFKVKMESGLETKKAYNHNTRKDKTNKNPYRPFFGINKKELKEIEREFKSELKQLKSTSIASRIKRTVSTLLAEAEAVEFGEDQDQES